LRQHLVESAAIETARQRIGVHHRRELGAQMVVRMTERGDSVGLAALVLLKRPREITALRGGKQIHEHRETAILTGMQRDAFSATSTKTATVQPCSIQPEFDAPAYMRRQA
jgi:hypothetical protein